MWHVSNLIQLYYLNIIISYTIYIKLTFVLINDSTLYFVLYDIGLQTLFLIVSGQPLVIISLSTLEI